MNIIDNPKGKAFQALAVCERYADMGDKTWALVQYGRAIGIMQALDELVGTHADTTNLLNMRKRLEDKLGC